VITVARQRRGAVELPIDDPRWMPVVEAHKRQCELTGEPQLAARELTEAMARERDGTRSMRRSIYGADPDRELLPPSHWTKCQLWWRSEAKTLIVRSRDRSDPKGPDGDIGQSHSYAYYVWRPDLEKIQPTTLAAAAPAQPTQPPRRRGPPTTHDWHSIDGEIARRCIDPKTGRVRVPKSERKLAEGLLHWLSDQNMDQPAESEMREAVRRVCAALRTVQK
jgi:hypothetical protein